MIEKLLERLDESTCNFLAVARMRRELEEAGFIFLSAEEEWDLVPRGKYYTVKNGSAVFAFVIGDKTPSETGLRMIAAHSDSPCFKIKPCPE